MYVVELSKGFLHPSIPLHCTKYNTHTCYALIDGSICSLLCSLTSFVRCCRLPAAVIKLLQMDQRIHPNERTTTKGENAFVLHRYYYEVRERANIPSTVRKIIENPPVDY